MSATDAEETRQAEQHDLSFHIFHPLSTTKPFADSSNINISLIYSRMGEVHGVQLSGWYSTLTGF